MSSPNESSWRGEIRKKLSTQLEKNRPEDLCRIFHFLEMEDHAYKNRKTIPPTWRSLKSAEHSEVVFKTYAEHLIEDTKKQAKDPRFLITMSMYYDEMLGVSKSSLRKGETKTFQRDAHDDRNLKLMTNASIGFIGAWSFVSYSSETQISQFHSANLVNRTFLSEFISMITKVDSPTIMVVFVAFYLTNELKKNLYRWWKIKISIKRCAKNIIDTSVSIAAAAGGGAVGADLGTSFGRTGMLIGGVVSSVVSTAAASSLCDLLTQYLFGIPKSEDQENEHNFLRRSPLVYNEDVKAAFRKLCLKYHPDQGGSKEEFMKACMQGSDESGST